MLEGLKIIGLILASELVIFFILIAFFVIKSPKVYDEKKDDFTIIFKVMFLYIMFMLLSLPFTCFLLISFF